jgi:deoxyribodipyrimidine photolyase-like uncharacterized protein
VDRHCRLQPRKKIHRWAKNISAKELRFESPNFYNSEEELREYFSKKKFFLNDFYIHERKKRQVLLEPSGEPVGGKWTFDTENRAKAPKGMAFPKPFVSTPNDGPGRFVYRVSIYSRPRV